LADQSARSARSARVRVWRPVARAVGYQLRRPGVVVALGFAAMILLVTLLLMLPIAHERGVTTSFREALFTATSAVCVTGLIVVYTPTLWVPKTHPGL
jgi:Trk-type K+ transport system membrane component